jgi:transcriptional regulator with XRE-family HTH domain
MTSESTNSAVAARPIDQDPAKIRRLRYASGLAGKDLAARAGVSPTYYSQIERGTCNASARALGLIAAALGCSPLDLMPDLPTAISA